MEAWVKAGQCTMAFMEMTDLSLFCENNLPGQRIETQMDATYPLPPMVQK